MSAFDKEFSDDDYDEAGIIAKLEGEESEHGELEPFNMDRERKEGLVDEEGIFKTVLDPDARDDIWLQDWNDREQIRAAKEAQTKRRRMLEEKATEAFSEEALWKSLHHMLIPGKTVLQTLQGYKVMPVKKGGLRPTNPHAAKITEITDICAKLMDLGHTDVYEHTTDSIFNKLSS